MKFEKTLKKYKDVVFPEIIDIKSTNNSASYILVKEYINSVRNYKVMDIISKFNLFRKFDKIICVHAEDIEKIKKMNTTEEKILFIVVGMLGEENYSVSNSVDIDAILNTHMHTDHIKGTAKYESLSANSSRLHISDDMEIMTQDRFYLALLYTLTISLFREINKKDIYNAIFQIAQWELPKYLYEPTSTTTITIDDISEKTIKTLQRNGSGIDVKSLENKYLDIENKLVNRRNEINNLETELQALAEDIRIASENRKICKDELLFKEIIKYFGDKIIRIKEENSYIEIYLEAFLDSFDEDDWKDQFSKEESSLSRYLEFENGHSETVGSNTIYFNQNETFIPFFRSLVEDIFINKTAKLLVKGKYVMHLHPVNHSWRKYNEDSETVLGNPHLFYYNCWNESVQAISECYRKNDLYLIPLYLHQALRTLTLKSDPCPKKLLYTLYYMLQTKNPERVIVDNDGYAYSVNEYFLHYNEKINKQQAEIELKPANDQDAAANNIVDIATELVEAELTDEQINEMFVDTIEEEMDLEVDAE